MVGDSYIGRRHGIQYCEGDADCRCYECEIKRLRSERDSLAAELAAVRSHLIEVAAECHRAKWEFESGNDEPTTPAFRALHRIGDMAKWLIR